MGTSAYLYKTGRVCSQKGMVTLLLNRTVEMRYLDKRAAKQIAWGKVP